LRDLLLGMAVVAIGLTGFRTLHHDHWPGSGIPHGRWIWYSPGFLLFIGSIAAICVGCAFPFRNSRRAMIVAGAVALIVVALLLPALAPVRESR
jgi:hypothetical protein